MTPRSNSNPPKKILITGASGYVGQHLTASIGFLGLKDSGNRGCRYQLYCTYNSLSTYEDDLKLIFDDHQRLLHPSIVSITPIQINFNDYDGNNNYVSKIRSLCGTDGIDLIVHLGALSDKEYCEEHPKEAWSVNCPIGLLELDAPIIYLSTDEVYEGNRQCFYKEEFDNTIPINVYARTKLAFDRVLLRGDPITNAKRQSALMRHVRDRIGLLSNEELGESIECRSYMPDICYSPLPNPGSVILRSSMILGPLAPFAHGCSRGECPTFLQTVASQISSSKPSQHLTNIFRSVVHVNDVVHTIKHFVHKALNGQELTPYRQELVHVEVYNLGGSKRESHYDVALEVARRLKVDESLILPVRGESVGEGNAVKAGGALRQPNVSMNVDKLMRELGLKRMKSLTSVVKASFYCLPSLYRYARQNLTRDNCHFTFAASHEPVLRIQPNEMVHIETFDCFKGAYFEMVDEECDNYALHEQPRPVANPESVIVERSKQNPVTGPIFVEGALPGDILSVKIHHIHPRRRGVTSSFGPGIGQLGGKVRRSCFRYFDIGKDRQFAVMSRDNGKEGGESNTALPDIVIKCQPMLGVIGVAPAEGEIDTMPAGKHGGNLDNNENGIQSTIHIQVNTPGALLSIGDMHAAQGDGEICGCGIEISGDVLLSCSIIKKQQEKKKNEYPITETATKWITHGVAVEDIPTATSLACEEAATLLVNEWGFTYEDALVYLGVAGNLGLCQSIHPCQGTVIAKMSVPKIAACPRPYRDLT